MHLQYTFRLNDDWIIEELVTSFRLDTSECDLVLSCNEVLVFKDGYFPLVLTVLICMFSDVFMIRIICTGCVLDEGVGFHLNVVVFLFSTSQEHETRY